MLTKLIAWLESDASVCSAVLFGSQTRAEKDVASADRWSDIDLHLIVTRNLILNNRDWTQIIPDEDLRFQVLRPATGGVQKLTLLFGAGEVDVVLVPLWQMRAVRIAMRCGWHRRIQPMDDALNAMATIMSGGYRFLKGARHWHSLYARVVAEMPGVRINNDEARRLADVFLCDLLWVLDKIQRGELVAAQRILHRSLNETNIQLLHELRVRTGEPTFQQARRVESLLPDMHLGTVQVNSRLAGNELQQAAGKAFTGLRFLMARLVPDWSVPSAMQKMIVDRL